MVQVPSMHLGTQGPSYRTVTVAMETATVMGVVECGEASGEQGNARGRRTKVRYIEQRHLDAMLGVTWRVRLP